MDGRNGDGSMRRVFVISASLLFIFAGSVYGKDIEKVAQLSISPKESRAKVGREVIIQIKVQEGKDLFGAPFYLVYDPKLLEVLKVSQGEFFKKDGKRSAFLQKVDPKAGRIIIGQTRMGKVEGMDGKGTLVLVTFKALHKGKAALSFENVDFRNSRLSSLEVHTQPAVIDVE
jgi:general secretion pathway protein D